MEITINKTISLIDDYLSSMDYNRHSFNINNMPNFVKKIKEDMKLFTPEEQLEEINWYISEYEKLNSSCVNYNKKFILFYVVINQLKAFRKELLSKHKLLQ